MKLTIGHIELTRPQRKLLRGAVNYEREYAAGEHTAGAWYAPCDVRAFDKVARALEARGLADCFTGFAPGSTRVLSLCATEAGKAWVAVDDARRAP